MSTWIHGVDSKWSPLPYTATSEYPSHGTPASTEDMTGGPGFEGLAELERFLDGGGTVITLANGGNLAIGTGLVRELTPVDAAGLVHPTSIVQVTARRPDGFQRFKASSGSHWRYPYCVAGRTDAWRWFGA